MIRNLLATTAVATLIATGAMAQTAPSPAPASPGTSQTEAAPAAPMVVKAEGHLASNLIGQNVYNGSGDDAESIGEVSDIVISPDNQIQAIVIGVGGFLGIGKKDVAIEYDLVEWAERDGDRFLVVETTADALKAQQEFDRQAYQPMPADADVAEVKPATREDLANAPVQNDNAAADTTSAPAAGTTGMAAAPAAGGTTQDGTSAPAANNAAGQTAQAPATGTDSAAGTDSTETSAIDRSTLTERPMDQISSDDFIGTTVYGANEEDVGEISEVVMSQDGKVDAVIVDVGGFLGMGEKSVAMGMENLTFMSDEDGDLYLYTNFTKEQLEAQPEYDPASFAQNRDNMLMMNEAN